MDYRWRYETEQGTEVAGPEERFEDQEEAESWLTDTFGELVSLGIDQVTLLRGDEVIYGPMSLHPA